MEGIREGLLSAALALVPASGSADGSPPPVSPRKSAHVIWYEADAHGVDQVVHRALRHSRPAHRNAAPPRD